MTSIYAGRNPARALYKLWSAIIDTNGGGSRSTYYGGGRSLIHRYADDHMISYGNLTLAKDGRFQLNHMHGHIQRKKVCEGTFLGFNYWRNWYQWFVDFDEPSYYASTYVLGNWQKPVPYVSELVLGNRSWRYDNTWMVLEQYDAPQGLAPWRIVPAKNQNKPGDPWATKRKTLSPEQQRIWVRHEALVQRRYSQMFEEATGMKVTTKTSVRTPSVTSNGTKHEGDAAVHVIRALLDVHQPAKLATKRLEEAHHE